MPYISDNRIKYYKPSASLVDFLDNELQNLRVSTKLKTVKSAGGKKYVRKNTNLAKGKHDAFSRIYQSFIDLVYFLEVIEINPELHELYEDTLIDLFGVNMDNRLDDINKDNSLFTRFLSAALFNGSGHQKTYNFRIHLVRTMISQALDHMRALLTVAHDPNEVSLFNSNVINTLLWSRLMANRYNTKVTKATHRIDYKLPK